MQITICLWVVPENAGDDWPEEARLLRNSFEKGQDFPFEGKNINTAFFELLQLYHAPEPVPEDRPNKRLRIQEHGAPEPQVELYHRFVKCISGRLMDNSAIELKGMHQVAT